MTAPEPFEESCTVSTLRSLEQFAEVPDAQLEWLISRGSCAIHEEGEQVFKPGDPINELQIMLNGRVRFYTMQQGNQRQLGEFAAPFIAGTLPYSRLREATGYGMTIERTRVLNVHREHFPEMIKEHYELTAALVHHMTNRVRNFTVFQQQNEKLMSLGKLSAGLAHELNNPASAVVRSARELKKHLKAVPESFKEVTRMQVGEAEVDAINNLLFQKINGMEDLPELSLMDRTEREDELAAYLEDRGMEDGYAVSENLVDFGFGEEDLDYICSHSPEGHLVAVINWINDNLVTERMVGEIEEASNRIAELVLSVKSYTHMDQAQDKQPVNVHQGIKSTVTMLAHKVKKGNITIEKEFQEGLSTVMGFPGEMNQVFTNILDNAIDALRDQEGAKIVIKTVADNDFLRIYFRDNGPGIPEDVLQKIFDPFFTTKAIGEGTGMGLDVVKKAMDHHNGKVEVKSEPGATEFCLCFPIHE